MDVLQNLAKYEPEICLSINGMPVDDAERATELLRDYAQDNNASPEEKKDSSTLPEGLVIMLVFSITKLRYNTGISMNAL